MSNLDFKTAQQEMITMVTDVWPSGTPLQLPNIDLTPPSSGQWGRLTIQHSFGGQQGFGSNVNRHNRTGFLTVQIFDDKGKGLNSAYDLAKIVIDAFDGKTSPGNIWFRDGRIQEAPDDEAQKWAQINVLVDFSYDEIK